MAECWYILKGKLCCKHFFNQKIKAKYAKALICLPQKFMHAKKTGSNHPRKLLSAKRKKFAVTIASTAKVCTLRVV